MLINFLEGGGGSYLRPGAPLTFWWREGVLLEAGCSLTFWRGGGEGLTRGWVLINFPGHQGGRLSKVGYLFTPLTFWRGEEGLT